ncbi:MAG: hypothetical protein ACYTBJ_25260 [Planctomycetota bacterium]|jgi:hypothetical protein
MSEAKHFYYTIRRMVLGIGNWNNLVEFTDEIQVNGDRAEHQLTKRVNLSGDAVNYEGRFPDGAVSFPKFAQKMATEFDVDVNDIGIVENMESYGIIAVYTYAGDDRLSIQIHGWESDDNPGTLQQSRVDAKAMIISQIEQWE